MTLSTIFHGTSDSPAAKPSRIQSLVGALAREIRVRRALRDVASLDDAALCDIGLCRGGIEDAIRHGRE